jgi:hypothetical protein
MYKVSGKIMSDAMISSCCANFLSDMDIKPGIAQSGGALNKNKDQNIRFTNGYTAWSEACLKLRQPNNMIAGSMRWERFAERATLDLDYKWFRFRETKNGFSMLTLWDRELPATICAAISPAQYRLLDLVDFSNLKPFFFVRANPEVHSLKNVVRMCKVKGKYGSIEKVRSKAILITMKDYWSQDNWGYWSSEYGYKSTFRNP